MLLRVFGANVGDGVIIRPSARITYPWKVTIGANSWIGDRAELYSLDRIEIGADCCISQDCYLATASHDIHSLSFDYVTGPICVDNEAWLASGVFIMPGITIGKGAVIAARSVVTKDVSSGAIVAGIPARNFGVRHENTPPDQ